MYTYGSFLQHVPSRLGINKALDASVIALTEAHSAVCTRSGATPRALITYSDALTTLRMTLDDINKACATETLCATMILSICEVSLGYERKKAALLTAFIIRVSWAEVANLARAILQAWRGY